MFVELLKLTGNYIIVCLGDFLVRGKLVRMSDDEKSIVLQDVSSNTSKPSTSNYYQSLTSSINLFASKGINIPEMIISIRNISIFFLDSDQEHTPPLKIGSSKNKSIDNNIRFNNLNWEVEPPLQENVIMDDLFENAPNNVPEGQPL